MWLVLQWLMSVHRSLHTSLPAKNPNTVKQHLSHTTSTQFSFFFQICCCEIAYPFKDKSISALESESLKSIGERWSRHVSDFHPRHQWSSLNSSTQHNPQPVGKCEKLHKVIYTLMSIFPKNSNGTQFKDTTVTFSLFSKIIPRGFHWVLSTYYFFSLNEWHSQNRQVTSGQIDGFLLSKQALQTNLKLYKQSKVWSTLGGVLGHQL